jgi:cation:H+ antiporter
MTLILLVAGLCLLVLGGDLLVRGAARTAARAGVSPLVIGLTVVAFGTSAPEMVVSVMSSAGGRSDIALGNVVGSNIFNVLFILGLSSAIAPLVVSQRMVRIEVPIMIALSGLVYGLGLDGRLGRVEGVFLLAGLVAYTVMQIGQSRKEKDERVKEEYQTEFGAPAGRTAGRWSVNIALIAAGLALLVLGSRWFVTGAVEVARHVGVSDLVIGLTVVAAGTSLPEVATSVVASIRGERDIAVGNIVGSNILNILGVLGLSAVVGPNGLEVSRAVLSFDLPVMTAVAAACLPVFFTGHLIARWEGLLFLFYYAAYTLYLILAASQHDVLPLFSSAMTWFVLPFTLLTLAVVAARSSAGARRLRGDGEGKRNG